jgi:hypothetical protein
MTPQQAGLSTGATLAVVQRGRSWTPWLVVRYTAADQGWRPIPASDPFWISPDIWVESSDPNGNAVAGEPNFVHARVLNLGKAPALPTRLDFYWGNPALGLGAGQMNLIGTEWVMVDAHAVETVRCQTPWIPVVENGGHECVIVNCSSPILDPIVQPFQPTLDRHVGQRNLAVLQAGQNQVVHFGVNVNNFFPVPARIAVGARIEHAVAAGAASAMTERERVTRVIAAAARQRSSSHEASDGVGISSSQTHIASQLSGPAAHTPDAGARASLGRFLLQTPDAATAPGAAVQRDVMLQETTMEPFEQRHLTLEIAVPASIKSGEYLVVHLWQRFMDLSMGGYTIIIRVVRA